VSVISQLLKLIGIIVGSFKVSGLHNLNSFGGNFVRRHLHSRINFKLNRATALTECRQLLSA
jgi:hypothetical protein